jgi:molecular chaperone DnaK (HSP70)
MNSDAQGHTWLTATAIDRQIPAILSYVDGEEYYGQQAKNFLVRNPRNTVAYFRDFLGKE